MKYVHVIYALAAVASASAIAITGPSQARGTATLASACDPLHLDKACDGPAVRVNNILDGRRVLVR